MPTPQKPDPANGTEDGPFGRFIELARRLFAVTKKEIEAEEEERRSRDSSEKNADG